MRLIVNSGAGRGRGAKVLAEVRRILIDHEGDRLLVQETAAPGHATELAESAAREGCPKVLVLGGDGTIAEVANGLVGTGVQLGILSVGTGNDLARSLGLPYNDVASALRVVRAGRVKAMDVGCDQGRYFLTALGVGYPALVARETNQLRWVKGSPAFFVAVYKALRQMKAVPVRITLDEAEIRMKCSSILVHNTSFTGGGLKMAPEASVDDGLFDVVLIDEIGRLDLMLNFPRVYSGSHLDHPHFFLHHTRRIRIEADPPIRKMYDGDPGGWTPVDASVIPGALNVFVPAPDGRPGTEEDRVQ